MHVQFQDLEVQGLVPRDDWCWPISAAKEPRKPIFSTSLSFLLVP